MGLHCVNINIIINSNDVEVAVRDGHIFCFFHFVVFVSCFFVILLLLVVVFVCVVLVVFASYFATVDGVVLMYVLSLLIVSLLLL